mgnify:CR=1 FL=1
MLLLLQLQIVQKVVLGNSTTATKLQTARNIALSGAVKGNANFDGSGNITINTSQNNFIVVDGQITLQANSQSNLENNIEQQTILNIDFPSGFNKDNCVCVAFGMKAYQDKNYTYGIGANSSNRATTGSLYRHAILGAADNNRKIALQVWQMGTSTKTVYYRLILMKIN